MQYADLCLSCLFLVCLRSSPPLNTQSSAIKMFASLPSSRFSLTKGNVVARSPLCNLAYSVTALRMAVNTMFNLLDFLLLLNSV